MSSVGDDGVAFSAQVRGVVVGTAADVSAPDGQKAKVVYKWTDSGKPTQSGEWLIERVDEIHQLYKVEYARSGDAKDARLVVRSTECGAKFAIEYRRFFDLITDAATVEIPQRMALVHKMIGVTSAMHEGRITQDACRTEILRMAAVDMEMRRNWSEIS